MMFTKKTIKSAISQNVLIHAGIIMILGSIPFMWFANTLHTDTSMIFFITPHEGLSRFLDAWDAKENFGSPTTLKTGQTFPSLTTLSFLSYIGLAPNQLQYVWITSIIIISGLGMYYAAGIILGSKTSWANLVVAIAYMIGPFMLVYIHDSSFLVLPYMIFPVLVGLSIKGVRKEASQLKYSILFGAAVVLASFTNMTMVIIVLIGAGLFAAYELIQSRATLRSFAKYIALSTVFSFCFGSWYFVPVIPQQLNNLNQTLSFLDLESPAMYNQFSSYLEVIRLMGNWAVYGSYQGKPYYNYGSEYTTPSLVSISSFLVPAIAIGSLMLWKNSEEKRNKLFLGLLLLAVIPLAVGGYHPESPRFTAPLYLWLYNQIDALSIFRNSLKWEMILAFVYSILIGYIVRFVLGTRNNLVSKKALQVSLVAGISAIIVTSSLPFLDGRVREADARLNIPSYWYEAAQWINAQEGQWRVLLMPNGYLPIYEWGRPGGEIADTLITKPIVYNIAYQNPTVVALYNSTSHNSQYLSELFGLHGIKYIIQRNDVPPSYYGVEDQNAMKEILSTKEGIIYLRTFGKLDIYENTLFSEHVSATSSLYEVDRQAPVDALSAILSGEGGSAVFDTSWSNSGMPNGLIHFSDGEEKLVFNVKDDNSYTLYLHPSSVKSFNMEIDGNPDRKYFVGGGGFYITKIVATDSHVNVLIRNNLHYTANLTVTALDEYSNMPWPNISVREVRPGESRTVQFPLQYNAFDNPDFPQQVSANSILNFKVIEFKNKNEFTKYDEVRVNYGGEELFNTSVLSDAKASPAAVENGFLKVPDILLEKGTHEIEITDAISDEPVPADYAFLVSNTDFGEPRLTVVREESSYVEVSITSPNDFVLVLDESFHEGWKAYMNGEQLATHMVVDGYKNGWIIKGPVSDAKVLMKFYYADLHAIGYVITFAALAFSLIYFSTVVFNLVDIKSSTNRIQKLLQKIYR